MELAAAPPTRPDTKTKPSNPDVSKTLRARENKYGHLSAGRYPEGEGSPLHKHDFFPYAEGDYDVDEDYVWPNTWDDVEASETDRGSHEVIAPTASPFSSPSSKFPPIQVEPDAMLTLDGDQEHCYLPSAPYSVFTPGFRHGPIALEKHQISKSAQALNTTLDWTGFQMAILEGEMFESSNEPTIWDSENGRLAEDMTSWFDEFGFETHGSLIPGDKANRTSFSHGEVDSITPLSIDHSTTQPLGFQSLLLGTDVTVDECDRRKDHGGQGGGAYPDQYGVPDSAWPCIVGYHDENPNRYHEMVGEDFILDSVKEDTDSCLDIDKVPALEFSISYGSKPSTKSAYTAGMGDSSKDVVSFKPVTPSNGTILKRKVANSTKPTRHTRKRELAEPDHVHTSSKVPLRYAVASEARSTLLDIHEGESKACQLRRRLGGNAGIWVEAQPEEHKAAPGYHIGDGGVGDQKLAGDDVRGMPDGFGEYITSLFVPRMGYAKGLDTTTGLNAHSTTHLPLPATGHTPDNTRSGGSESGHLPFDIGDDFTTKGLTNNTRASQTSSDRPPVLADTCSDPPPKSTTASTRESKFQKVDNAAHPTACQLSWRLWFTGFLYPPAPGYTRIPFTCGCGDHLYVDVREKSPGGIDRLRQKLSRCANAVRERAQDETASPSPPKPPSTPPRVHMRNVSSTTSKSSYLSRSSSSSSLSDNSTTATSQILQSPLSHDPQYLLICVNGKRLKTLQQIDLNTHGNDQQMFQQIREVYQSVRDESEWKITYLIPRCVRRIALSVSRHWPSLSMPSGALHMNWTSFRRTSTADFVRFQILPIGRNSYPGCLQKKQLPPPEEVWKSRYLYEPVPRQDVEFFEIPLPHLLSQGEHLDDFWMTTFPKKLHEPLVRKHGAAGQCVVGWGIDIKEELNWRCILFFISAVLLLTGVGVVIYVVVASDPSSAFGLGAYLVAVITTFIAYQYFAWRDDLGDS